MFNTLYMCQTFDVIVSKKTFDVIGVKKNKWNPTGTAAPQHTVSD